MENRNKMLKLGIVCLSAVYVMAFYRIDQFPRNVWFFYPKKFFFDENDEIRRDLHFFWYLQILICLFFKSSNPQI